MGRSGPVVLSIAVGGVIALGCQTMVSPVPLPAEESVANQAGRVRELVSVLREEPDSASPLGLTKRLAAVELGKIGLEHPLPKEAIAALKEVLSDHTPTEEHIHCPELGSGTVFPTNSDGAAIAFAMWQLRDMDTDLERAAFLWRTLSQPDAGDGLMMFCADELAKMDSESVLPYLGATAMIKGRGPVWYVSRRATKRLVDSFPASRDLLLALTDTERPDPVVVDMAQEALDGAGLPHQALREAQDHHALIRALSNPDWLIRRAAAAELGYYTMRQQAVGPLGTAATQDNDWLVRLAATSALGQIGGPPVQAPLVAALKDWCWLTRARAIKGLAAIAGPETLTAIMQGLHDPHWLVREAAATALGRRDEPEARAALRTAMDDPHPAVRFRAAESLGDSSHQPPGPP